MPAEKAPPMRCVGVVMPQSEIIIVDDEGRESLWGREAL